MGNDATAQTNLDHRWNIETYSTLHLNLAIVSRETI